MNPDDVINQLPSIREDKRLWNQFAYSAAENVDAINTDKQWVSRYALTIALQYNWTSSDEELLRFIVKNEALMHSKSWGFYYSLSLSSYLLAKFRNPANVPLFSEAKSANLDTESGYDIQFVFSAGIRETVDYINSSGMPHGRFLLERVEGEVVDGYIDEAHLKLWFGARAVDYPASVEAENEHMLKYRAGIFGDD